MWVHIIGRISAGAQAQTYGKVHADSFDAAVGMVFANKLEYPVVVKLGSNEWRVRRALPNNREIVINVRAERMRTVRPARTQNGKT